jgi:hypothetical protein
MSRFRLIDPTHPFFAKPWRRWLTVALLGLWAVWEAVNLQWVWAGVFGALAIYAYGALVLNFPKDPD